MSNIEYVLKKSDQENVGMEDSETLKAESYIRGKQKMLEWGSGGSTIYFPQLVDHYISIEHDLGWYNKIKPNIHSNTEFYHVPIHENKFDEELDSIAHEIYTPDITDAIVRDGISYWNTRGDFDWHCGMDYIKKPLELGYDYDVILVDGRCRAMCACVAKNLLKDGGYLLFHDFNNRIYYSGILKYYEIVDTVESLAVLIKK